MYVIIVVQLFDIKNLFNIMKTNRKEVLGLLAILSPNTVELLPSDKPHST